MFRNDSGSKSPTPDIESWKKEIGERLRYSSAELRKNVDQLKGEVSRCDRRQSLLTTADASVQDEKDHGRVHGWKTVFNRACCCGKLLGLCSRFTRRLTRYQITRQSAFTQKIDQLGWLEPAFIESPDSGPVLQYCTLRYHG